MSLRHSLRAGLFLSYCSLFVPASANESCAVKLPEVRVGSPSGPSVSAASLSPDGKLLAIGIEDKDYSGLFTFGLPSGKLLWAHGNGSAPDAVDISPDGSKVAVGYKTIAYEAGMCPHVELLNSADGKQAAALEFPAYDRAQSVRFSHDGRLIATAVKWELQIWNSASGVRFSSLEMPSNLGKWVDYAYSLVFSPDDGSLAVSDPNASSVYVWSVSGSKIIRRFRISAKPNVNSGAIFSTDGKLIAVGSRGSVKVFTLAAVSRGASAQICEIVQPAGGEIKPVAFTPDHDLWIESPTGFEKWKCAVHGPPQRLVEGKLAFDRVFALKGGSFVGMRMTGGQLSLIDAQSGKQIAAVPLPGRGK